MGAGARSASIWLIGCTPQRYEECLFLEHLCGNVKHVCVLSRQCHQHRHLIGFARLRLDKFLFLLRYIVLESMLMGSIYSAHIRNSVNLSNQHSDLHLVLVKHCLAADGTKSSVSWWWFGACF